MFLHTSQPEPSPEVEGAAEQTPAHREDLLTFYWCLERFGNCHHHVGAKDLEQRSLS